MGFLQLMIINKSGGLIYNQNLSPQAPELNDNDWLRIGSTFHSLHAIATQVAPVVSAGIEKLETETFRLQCFQTLTGIKFIITADAGTTALDVVLRMIYELYSDYVLKNPFYELEMPIRCHLFTTHVTNLIQSFVQTGTAQNARHAFHTKG